MTGQAARNPHGVLIRSMLRDPGMAQAFLRQFLPEDITTHLSDEPPELIDCSYIEPALSDRYCDAIVRVPLETSHDLMVYILGLGERDHRALAYLQRCVEELGNEWRRDNPHAPLPVVPMILYYGDEPWTGPDALIRPSAD